MRWDEYVRVVLIIYIAIVMTVILIYEIRNYKDRKRKLKHSSQR